MLNTSLNLFFFRLAIHEREREEERRRRAKLARQPSVSTKCCDFLSVRCVGPYFKKNISYIPFGPNSASNILLDGQQPHQV